MEKVIDCLTVNYANFSGRANRSEYWFFVLFCFIVSFVISFIGGILKLESISSIILFLLQLALLIPSIALLARRLHDLNKSGWWMLISFIPILGGLCLLVLCCLRGTTGSNSFGDDPLASV